MRVNSKNKKPQLYEGYLQKNVAKREREAMEKRFGNEVVIKKVSTSAEVMRILVDLFYRLAKFFLWLCIVILCSIAVTVLMNSSTRQALFGLFGL